MGRKNLTWKKKGSTSRLYLDALASTCEGPDLDVSLIFQGQLSSRLPSYHSEAERCCSWCLCDSVPLAQDCLTVPNALIGLCHTGRHTPGCYRCTCQKDLTPSSRFQTHEWIHFNQVSMGPKNGDSKVWGPTPLLPGWQLLVHSPDLSTITIPSWLYQEQAIRDF